MSLPHFLPTSTAALRGVHNGRVVWAYPTTVVQDTPELIALYLPAGAAGKNVARQPKAAELGTGSVEVVDHIWHSTDVLMLIVPGDAFSIYAMWAAGTANQVCWYINLQEPIRRTPIGFDTMDQILDLVVSPDLASWKWKDEEEFAAAERAGYYTGEQASAIRAEGLRALSLLVKQRRAFYAPWGQWRPDPAWGMPLLSPDWNTLFLVEGQHPG